MSAENCAARAPRDTLGLDGLVREFGPQVWRFLRYLGVLEPDLTRVTRQVFAGLSARDSRNLRASSVKTAVYERAVRIWFSYEPQSGFATMQSEPKLAQITTAREQILELLALLSPQQRIVTALYEIEQLSINEIVEVLDSERAVVLATLNEARAELTKARANSSESCDSVSAYVRANSDPVERT